MLASTQELLQTARQNIYAIGAFNIYNLEGVKAVVSAAETHRSAAMLQIHPSALKYGRSALVAMCLEAARAATVPISVHLDHSTNANDIRQALTAGMNSIMADGSHLPYRENMAQELRSWVEREARSSKESPNSVSNNSQLGFVPANARGTHMKF